MNIREYFKIFIKYIILFLMSLTKVIPIKKNRFFFSNYFGKSGFGDNLKYIAETLHEKDTHAEIFWATDKNHLGQFPDYVKVVQNGSLRWFWAVITSKYWVDNERKHLYMYKKPQQFYLQTWHGGISLKYIEMDAVESYPEKTSYIHERKHDNKIVDAYVSNSKFCTNMYRTAFNYEGDIWEDGYPRNDILVSKDSKVRKKVLDFFAFDESVMLVMYAPTYRKDKSTEVYKLDFEKVMSTLNKKYNREIIFLIRLHPNVVTLADSIKYTDTIINASNYDDIQELMVATDILITDYSNVMFEFSYQLKPCFLYAPDFNAYLEDRKLYFDYESLPYPVAYDEAELITNIENFEVSKYKNNVRKFLADVGIIEPGNATKKIVDKLLYLGEVGK